MINTNNSIIKEYILFIHSKKNDSKKEMTVSFVSYINDINS